MPWKPENPQTRVQRWTSVDDNGCWLWQGRLNDLGYGRALIGSRSDNSTRRVMAHRFAYEAFVGPIPAGLELDHLCRVTSCVNPAHLEPVSPQENTLRSDSTAAIHARKACCPRCKGPYSTYRNRRICVSCRNADARRRYAASHGVT